MSEIVLSNSTNHYDYSNGSMMVNINPGLVQKSSSNSHGSPPPGSNFVDNTIQQQQQQYSTYPGKKFFHYYITHLRINI
jgi:hypothetical protein